MMRHHPRSRVRPHAVSVVLVAMAVASPVLADGDASGVLSIRVMDAPVVAYDSTALGRGTHPLRLVITNQGTRPVPLEPLVVRFRPTRGGITFSCDEPRSRDDRWPAMLDPNATFGFARDVTCETPLPGRYDVEVLARFRSAPATAERGFGSFVLQVDPGANPPVRLPWEPSLYGAASGTKDMRPTNDPAAARIVVSLTNATKVPVTLAPLRASMLVRRRGSSIQACPERSVDLQFSGTLAPGRSRALATPLGCDISPEALYDVEIWVANANGAKVRLATHPIRVRVNAPVSPGPQDDQKSPFVGGS
jgi:hypothetical protein